MNIAPGTKLSAAIRNGMGMVPFRKGQYFSFAATGREYAQGIAHHRDLLGADALGTALIGLAGSVPAAIDAVFDGPTKGPHALLPQLYPHLREKRVPSCPKCAKKTGINGPILEVGFLWHMQDQHGWTRTEVIEWLEKRGE